MFHLSQFCSERWSTANLQSSAYCHRKLGQGEEGKLAENGDVWIDDDVVLGLRIGVWDVTLGKVGLTLDDTRK